MEILGWIGSLLLAFCAAPQAVKSAKEGSTQGVSPTFLWAWFWGEIFTLFYVVFDKFSIPLIINYFVNLIFISIIIWFYYKPRKFDKS